jgi:hypothetical protein
VEFPHVQEMFKDLHPQGVEVISIAAPPRDSLQLMLEAHKTMLPVAMEEREWKDPASVNNIYQAGVKVWYVVDANRKVMYGGNYNPQKIRAALAKLGVSWERKGSFGTQ